jgi:tRNA-dihydrouridine synthase
MNVDGFLINPTKVIKHLLTTPNQKPIAQIYGGNEKTLIEAAVKIEKDYSEFFSGIELNTGCPSTTVMKCGGGSDMMKKRKKTLTIIQHLSETLKKLPLSLKSRTGLNEEDKKEQFEFLVEASQYCSKISIHGRTLKQVYSGEADWDFIQQVKNAMVGTVHKTVRQHQTPCQIIGNGGITSYEQAKTYNERYEVDIMIGQAAIGNPRIFTPHQPTMSEKLATILRHLDLSVACDQYFAQQTQHHPQQGVATPCTEETPCTTTPCIPTDRLETQIQTNLKKSDFSPHTIVEFRKFLFQYIKGIPESREWKTEILQVNNYGELREKIQQFFTP